MARAVRKVEPQFEPVFENPAPQAYFERGDQASVEGHARALQLRLAESYGVAGTGKLDARVGMAVIVGSAGALWLAIGVAVMGFIG